MNSCLSFHAAESGLSLFSSVCRMCCASNFPSSEQKHIESSMTSLYHLYMDCFCGNG